MGNSVKIFYQNVRGLNPEKFAYMKNLLDQGHIDIVALAETWFPAFLASHQHKRYVFTSSIDSSFHKPPCKPTNFSPRNLPTHSHSGSQRGHRPGGVMVMMRPADHNLWTATNSTVGVHLSRHGTVISFAYFPPSMNASEVSLSLEEWPSSDVIAADFNLRLDRPMTIAPRLHDLRDVWQSFCVNRNLETQVINNGFTRLDHVLAVPSKVTQLSYHEKECFPYSTDHPALTFLFHLRNNGPQVKESTQRENERLLFCLRPLREASTSEITASLLQGEYQSLAPSISRLIAVTQKRLDEELTHNSSRETVDACIKTAIDLIDDTLTSAVQSCCTEVLGRREARSCSRLVMGKPQLDTVPNTILSFTKVCKNRAQRPLKSANATTSPINDAHQRWSQYWHDPVERRNRPYCGRDSTFPLVNVKEVRRMIARQPNKSCHADGVHALALKALSGCSFSHHLTSLFNLCFYHQYSPDRWNHALTVLGAKDDNHSTENCRPLSIVPVFRSLFEKFIEREIRPHFSRIHSAQTGFRQNSDIYKNLKLIHNDCRPFKILVDFEKAYDSPDFSSMYQSWLHFNLPPWCRKLLVSLYVSNMRCQLVVNNKISKVIHRTKGFFQGTILSPHLFNIYVDPLLRELNVLQEISASAYADDTSLFADDQFEAQSLLNRLSEWAIRHSLKINEAKTVVLSPPDKPIYHLSGAEVIRKDSAKYLGLPIRHQVGIDWKAFMDTKMANCQKLLNWMNRITRSWPITARADIFRTFILPKVDFAGPLFASYTLKYDEETHRFSPLPEWQELWNSLNKFYVHLGSSITNISDSTIALRILSWTTLMERWSSLQVWHDYGRSSQPSEYHPIILYFQQRAENSAMCFNRPNFKILWNELYQRPVRKFYFLHRHQHPFTQKCIVKLYRHTFGYKGTCYCGEQFTQNEHFGCLPNSDRLEMMFSTEQWPDIDALFDEWSSKLAVSDGN